MPKPKIYEELPSNFDQTTQYAIQKEPVDMGEYIFYGVEIKDVETEDSEHEE